MTSNRWSRYRYSMSRLRICFLLFPLIRSPSCVGIEGNGNPLQCSCLENPRAGGAWWAAVYRVAQSRTQLTWLSSSSNLVLMKSINLLSHIQRPYNKNKWILIFQEKGKLDIRCKPLCWHSQIKKIYMARYWLIQYTNISFPLYWNGTAGSKVALQDSHFHSKPKGKGFTLSIFAELA